MIKIFSLLVISISVFYSPSINAHSYGGTENHRRCASGDVTWANGNEGNGPHNYDQNKSELSKC